ncbi:MAG: sodium/solute symporter [Nitrospinaceae bacterium]|nr:sodium/proline symporter [Nitrospinaceae bacterium]NIR54522.1 sodium/proline symporter [Nitrospinaceae bacterium]NIS84941.1 sodium/proline symporter [Nitrospinaceae bacterium]NIT81755.1 sodium/proline symporter [Nitrospinaceae bacterium]NIU44024.1 sodium/proline symporter [Nitrospinaceae bacterium]
MTELSGTISVVIVVYVILMLAIGYVTSRRTKSPSQFFLADRSLKAWVTAVSSTASSESAWAVLGTVGMAYEGGLSAVWFLPGCLMGYAINWLFLAERLRKHSHETGAITIPDYLEAHFKDRTHWLRIISVVIIFSCMMAYVGSQFTGIGKTFDAIFGVPHYWSIPVGGAIIILYTMMGGFLAVAWTDFIQGLIMVFGLVLLSLTALVSLGGFGGMIEQVNQAHPETLAWMGGKTTAAFLGSLVGLMGIGLGYPGQPHVLNRYMAAKDSRTIQQGIWIAMGWGLLIYSSAILLGLCGNALFPQLADKEHLFPKAAVSLLPTVVSAVVLTGVLAAIMSTVSAQIIVAASAVAHDIYSKMVRRDLSHRRFLWVSRLSVLLLGVGAMAIALAKTQVIFWFVLFAWSGLGASFGPVILFTLYSRKVTREGAIAGMLTGFVVTVVWKVTGLSDSVIYELVPAFLLASLAVWGVSQWTGEREGMPAPVIEDAE